MDYTEKTISTEEIFKGHVLQVKVDTVLTPDGTTSTRELVLHPGGVGVIALDERGRVPMVRQYRKAADEHMLEIPAGKLEWGEDPLACGIRELEEETGYYSEDLKFLCEFFPTPGYGGEKITLYLAKNLQKTEQNLDDGEFLDVEFYDLDTLVEMVLENKIRDAKTMIAILMAKNMQ